MTSIFNVDFWGGGLIHLLTSRSCLHLGGNRNGVFYGNLVGSTSRTMALPKKFPNLGLNRRGGSEDAITDCAQDFPDVTCSSRTPSNPECFALPTWRLVGGSL